MVNFIRRVILEDVVSYWWVNWGYIIRVSEQEVLYEGGYFGSDFGRVFVVDWFRRFFRFFLENGVKVCSFFKQYVFGGGSIVFGLERQYLFKKFRKENDMVQFFQGDSVDDIFFYFGKGNFKLLKGIFKKKVSIFLEGIREDFAFSFVFISLGQVVVLFFRKGIFKKFRQREFGYYSFFEFSESGEFLDAGDVFVSGDFVEQKFL